MARRAWRSLGDVARWRMDAQQRRGLRMTGRLQQKLHIGCGDVALAGWVNIDLAPYPAVDRVHDVTKPLPFESCSFIFAEHFIEHLSLHDGLRFLQHCRKA